MLASVYSYCVMVKSVSSCCVHGRRVLSNPVTYVRSYIATIIRYSSTCLHDSRDQSMTSKNIPPKVISCHKPASYHFVLKFILCLTGPYNIIERH